MNPSLRRGLLKSSSLFTLDSNRETLLVYVVLLLVLVLVLPLVVLVLVLVLLLLIEDTCN